MSEFIVSHLLLLCALAGTLFVPGWFWLRIFTHDTLSLLERAVFSMPLSFSLVTLLILITNKSGLPVTTGTTLTITLLLTIAPLTFLFFTQKKRAHAAVQPFSWLQTLSLITLITLTILIKTVFLTHTIFPTATDLGHHMFWAQKIVLSHELPLYTKIEVLPDNQKEPSTSTASFTLPTPIPDFIVGEHIIFAVITLLTGHSVISAFPSLILLLVNLMTIFALFLLARRLFVQSSSGTHAALYTLLLIGPLYAVSGAQAKFVSGGVIGNIFGNLLIVSILYFLYRALTEKSRVFLLLATFFSIALVYTHHLSVFILGYILIGTLLSFLVLNKNTIFSHIRMWRKLLVTPHMLLLLGSFLFFLFVVYTPSYLNLEAVSSSVGAPTKSTRVGIPLTQLMYMLGEARFVFGIFGGVFVLFAFTTSSYTQTLRLILLPQTSALTPYARALLLGWGGTLLIMVTMPALLHVNIISSRIATYLAFPLALLGGFFLAWLVPHIVKTLPRTLAYTTLTLLFLFLVTNGLRDTNTELSGNPKMQEAVQTFHAARYLGQTTPTTMWILKDHNYTTADTWMKVFINTDYSNPLSRSYFKRYETQPQREHCTLAMITSPASTLAQDCFKALSIGPVMVHTAEDAVQFLTNENFVKVYENNDSSIFWRK